MRDYDAYDTIVMPAVQRSKNHKYETRFIFYHLAKSAEEKGDAENPVLRAFVNIPTDICQEDHASEDVTYWQRIEDTNVAFFETIEDQTSESNMQINM